MDKHKSEIMAEVAETCGWKTQIKPTIPESKRFEEISWDLYCVRDKETLHVQWTGNRLTDSTYTFMGIKSKPTHKAAVLKVLGGQPSFKQVAKVTRRSVQKDRSANTTDELRQIPFKLDDPALDILKSVIGRDITWVRQFDGQLCTAYVPKLKHTNPKYLRIISAKSTGRRALEWSDAEGFHAVALEQIIQVG